MDYALNGTKNGNIRRDTQDKYNKRKEKSSSHFSITNQCHKHKKIKKNVNYILHYNMFIVF